MWHPGWELNSIELETTPWMQLTIITSRLTINTVETILTTFWATNTSDLGRLTKVKWQPRAEVLRTTRLWLIDWPEGLCFMLNSALLWKTRATDFKFSRWMQTDLECQQAIRRAESRTCLDHSNSITYWPSPIRDQVRGGWMPRCPRPLLHSVMQACWVTTSLKVKPR